jgi:hypothetical protein
MSAIILGAIAIALSIMFFGIFTGFVVGDNTEDGLIILASSVMPGIAVGYYLESFLAFVLWIASYGMGIFVAEVFRAGIK